MTTSSKLRLAAALALACVCSHTLFAQPVWTGGAGNGLWSDQGNWDPDYAGGTNQSYTFGNQTADLSSLIDAAFPINTNLSFLRIDQTSNFTNEITLGKATNLVSGTSALRYNSDSTAGSALSSADMFVLNLNGFRLNFRTNNSANSNGFVQFLGTLNFDAAGSAFDTGFNNTGDTRIDFGNSSSPAVLNVTANGSTGRVSTSTSADSNHPVNINFGSQATLNISNNSTFRMVNQIRSIGPNNSVLNVSNAGTFNIASGSTLSLERINNANVVDASAIGSLIFTNSGTVNQAGSVSILPDRNGTSAVSNSGIWALSGSNARITDARANVTGSQAPTFTNTSTGTIRGTSALDIMEFDSTNFVSTRLDITNLGNITPGAGHGGTALSSVGTLVLRDTNVTFSGANSTLTLDLGGTSVGQYDVFSLENGQTNATGAGLLTLDASSQLVLHYVNGFNGDGGFQLDILNYGSISGEFDLANNLTIVGGSGLAEDVNNYQIQYNTNSATLVLVPEPSVFGILIAGAGVFAIFGRRRRAA